MTNDRPHYGNAFEFDRVMNVFFYTSNTTKLLQARLLFMRHGYELRHFKADREPYDEDYALGTDLLLNRAIKQVNEEFGVRSIFFVEDTSLRIDALSDGKDFPGLAVKEWFPKTTFEELDAKLRTKNNRRATVFSDIALYIPTLPRPLFFHGETSGIVASSKPEFPESMPYPWLTPNTFNGWFIPNGSSKRLGEMEFEESLSYDFRAKSIRALLGRLQELNAALNLKPNFYTTRRQTHPRGQLSLIPEHARIVLLVVGPKCAGKTTFSDYMVANYDSVSVYEASNVLRRIAEDEGVIPSNSDEALAFLEAKGWDAVAHKIAGYIEMNSSRWNVVTGLRTPEELLLIKDRFIDAHIVLVDADPRVRFERHIKRARDQDLTTFRAFRDEDEKQQKFGALRVANDIAESTIRNEGSIEQYRKKIDELLGEVAATSTAGVSSKATQFGELHRCLSALQNIGKAASCEEIHDETARFGTPVRIYNTNRALKDVPEFATRIEKRDSLLQYEITARGGQLLKLLDIAKGSPEVKPIPLQLPFTG